MTRILFTLFLFNALSSSAQYTPVYKDLNFDSSYNIIALASSFHDHEKDSKIYNFLIDNVEDMNNIKKEWTIKRTHPKNKISIEENSIVVYVTKDRQLVDSRLLIYPNQGIVHFGAYWYDFDMKAFLKVQAAHPLIFHSQIFKLNSILEFAFFKDSIQNVPSFLFLTDPPITFEGQFTIVAPRSLDPDSPMFVLSDINKELNAIAPSQKFDAKYSMNDKFNLENTEKVKITVQCSKALYDSYKSGFKEKGEWIPSTIDTKVVFKD